MITKMLSFFFPPTEEIKEFCQNMISSPEKWVQGEYEFINKDHRDIAIWTCNGVPFMRISGLNSLSLGDKLYISKSIKKTMAKKILTPNKP